MGKLRDAFALWLCSGREERPTTLDLVTTAWISLMVSVCAVLLLRITGALLYMNAGWDWLIRLMFNDAIVGGLSVVFLFMAWRTLGTVIHNRRVKYKKQSNGGGR